MVRGAMLESGVNRDEFDIVPFPINYPELLFNYVPLDAKYYMTIYDEWSMEKKDSLQKLGCNIEVMWSRTNAEKITSGTEVRDLIIRDEPWRQFVPESVYAFVTANGIDARIRKISQVGG